MTFYEAILGVNIPSEFGVYSESDGLTPAAEEYIDNIFALAKKYNIDLNYAYGVSQLCFIVKGDPTVIKVAFTGMMEEWSEYDNETEEDIWHEEFAPFDIDYCSKAYEIYDLACDAGIEEFFAKMNILGHTFSNNTIWTQTFVTPLSTGEKSPRPASEDSLKKVAEITKAKYIQFEEEWLALAIDYYGEEKLKKLLAFLEENNIYDFHHANYGYTKDGFPMLLDYSSWD